MGTLKKSLVVLAVAFAVAGTVSPVLAGCGSCGAEKKHKHEHKVEACVKCEHAKACSAQDCDNAAHEAACTCVKTEEKKEDSAT